MLVGTLGPFEACIAAPGRAAGRCLCSHETTRIELCSLPHVDRLMKFRVNRPGRDASEGKPTPKMIGPNREGVSKQLLLEECLLVDVCSKREVFAHFPMGNESAPSWTARQDLAGIQLLSCEG